MEDLWRTDFTARLLINNAVEFLKKILFKTRFGGNFVTIQSEFGSGFPYQI